MRETVLHLIQVAEDLQLVIVRVVVDKSHTAHLQRVVDIVDIILDVLGALFEQQGVLLLTVVRLDHIRDVTPGGNDAKQFPVIVADDRHSTLIVELAFDGYFRYPFVFPLCAVDIGDRRHLQILYVVEVEIPV